MKNSRISLACFLAKRKTNLIYMTALKFKALSILLSESSVLSCLTTDIGNVIIVARKLEAFQLSF